MKMLLPRNSFGVTTLLLKIILLPHSKMTNELLKGIKVKPVLCSGYEGILLIY